MPRRSCSPTATSSSTTEALARGDTNAEIADGLYLSLSSVKSHVGTLMTKIGARNRVQMAIWAHQAGLTDT